MEHFGFKVACGAFMAYSMLAVNAQMQYNRRVHELLMEQTNKIQQIQEIIKNKTIR
jgi:hypothetical protein